MPSPDIGKERVASGGPNGGGMTYSPEKKSDQPEAQPEAERGGERAVQNGDRTRRPSEENGLGQGTVNGDDEAGNVTHQMSAPPPKEKKDRKKLEAAKAIDRPKTI